MSGFTCITCRVAFVDADMQRGHYKTDWHRYNLKRKVADMPPVTAENFQQRVIAQKAQLEDEQKDKSGHCKVCNKHFSTENAFQNHIKSKKHKDLESRKGPEQPIQDDSGEKAASKSSDSVQEKNAINISIQKAISGSGQGQSVGEGRQTPSTSAEKPEAAGMDVDDSDAESWESWEGDALGIEDCLFCSHVSRTLVKNMKHMTVQHSFFIPDLEYVTDLEGLVTYLGEKVGEGHICLWCNEKSKSFRSTQAVQQHMVDKGHCKMLHEGDTVFEYSDYYDYRKSYPDFDPNKAAGDEEEMELGDEDDDDDDDDDAEGLAEDLDAENYQLVLPSGAVIGHRSLQRYYRQKLRPDRQVAVRNPSSLTRVMAQYKSLGWTGSIGHMVHQKAKDVAFVRRLQSKRHMHLGVKANKLQTHFRHQILGC